MPKAKKDEQGRQDFRIDDMIPLNDEKLTPEEYQIARNRVGIRSRQSNMLRQMVGRDLFGTDGGDGVTPELAKGLESLDAKLNYLIGVNMLNDANNSHLQERPVNISVTGASFNADQKYEKGDAIRLTLMLPAFPPTILELVGLVRRVEKLSGGRLRVALQFHYRCDDEEDAVAKYVFRRQREMIRAESREADQAA